MSPNPCKALYVSHGGGPFPLLDEPSHKGLIQMLQDCRPSTAGAKGIVLFTAHWETSTPNITSSNDPGLLFDYGPMSEYLPPGAFSFKFPTPGNSNLANEIFDHLKQAGFEPLLDEKRGWDEGVFVPTALARPEWDIPIVQMSVLTGADESESTKMNIALGKAMRPFVEQGFLIIGSGSSSHDVFAIADAVRAGKSIESETWAFEEAIKEAASTANSNAREQKVRQWREWPNSLSAHLEGQVEHFMPFLIAAMAAGDGGGERVGFCDLAGTPCSCFAW